MKQAFILIAVVLLVRSTFGQAVISPPVQVLNFGPQPTLLDYQRAGAESAAPLRQAIEANNAVRNEFLMNQINNDFALRQQQLQIQAEAEAQQRQIQAQQEQNAASIERSHRISSATALVRQTADRNQARIEQGVAAIKNQNFIP